MNYKRLIAKIAADKENNKLGKIIRIDKLPGKTIKRYKPYAMILVNKRFRKSIIVPIEADKVIKIEGTYAWFDILKEDFDAELKRIKETKIEREIYHGQLSTEPSKGAVRSFDPYNLGHTRKERKR
ncbi:MAG: hypothetical protein HZR80_03905 [Candidatus Heimdallarchaeota archaeon]